jgi:hypothetical protein
MKTYRDRSVQLLDKYCAHPSDTVAKVPERLKSIVTLPDLISQVDVHNDRLS